MTLHEKRQAMRDYCNNRQYCYAEGPGNACPLWNKDCSCSTTENLLMCYDTIFREKKPDENVYWKRIEAIAERQRNKGLAKYRQGLEMNPMNIFERLTYLEEELVDALMYIEHIKAWAVERMEEDEPM